MVYKVKDGFVIRKIGPGIVAVPVGKRTSEIHGMISLTESGALLWNLLVRGADIQTLVKALLEEYDVDEATAAADAQAFINGLSEQGAIE